MRTDLRAGASAAGGRADDGILITRPLRFIQGTRARNSCTVSSRLRISSSSTFLVIAAMPLPSIAPLVLALVLEPPACSPGA